MLDTVQPLYKDSMHDHETTNKRLTAQELKGQSPEVKVQVTRESPQDDPSSTFLLMSEFEKITMGVSNSSLYF